VLLQIPHNVTSTLQKMYCALLLYSSYLSEEYIEIILRRDFIEVTIYFKTGLHRGHNLWWCVITRSLRCLRSSMSLLLLGSY
jgi:hypothetical protein